MQFLSLFAAAALGIGALTLPGPALAEISAEMRVALQGAMLSYVDSVLVDGAYTYLDPTADEMRTVYPANVHPMIVTVGDDYFVCSEMVTETGEQVTADFLVREVEGEWTVVQALLNDRASLETAMSKDM
ncbi:hypothetical protein [Pseudoroseicyclus tamaricis]|uniref:DUF4864 domain-containing protein n=1 Tax=Pseudoroseicyclus tamaricis TaxID=2705421 RepID=A0A6B2K3Q1_9RHOB|nr:hypothetical protein [Pseudoroseicyclus tamaricis]NDV01236.1 hypothetical protein [Pseudoroseicyclus tamaricis]